MAENILDDVLAVYANRHRGAVVDIAEDQGQMLHGIERGRIGNALRRSNFRFYLEFGRAFHQAFATLAVGDDIGD